MIGFLAGFGAGVATVVGALYAYTLIAGTRPPASDGEGPAPASPGEG